MANTIQGIVRKHRDGFGFLIQPKGSDDIYIPPEDMVGVMDGDRIEALVHKRRGRMAGQLVSIIERGRKVIIGTFMKRGRQCWVDPIDPGLHEAVFARIACDPPPGEGQSVKLTLTDWPTGVSPAKGEVVEVLGDCATPSQDVLAMAYSRGFSDSFPADVEAESEGMPDGVSIADLAGRRDLRALPLVTIDGADAKDFDDAIYVESIPNGGYRLVVAIADVAHYVRDGTALDREALSRGTSVYFPSMVLPMLPEKLSNGICSLVPNEDRLCLAVELTMAKSGKTINTEVYEAVMRSHARLTYDDVTSMMEDIGQSVDSRGAKLPSRQKRGPEHKKGEKSTISSTLGADARLRWRDENLEPAVELSRRLLKRRIARGCIDFDLPEPCIETDEEGMPISIRGRERLWPHRMVEEFMLAANEAIAYFFHLHALPAIYRVHDEPDPLKLESFAALGRSYGFSVRSGEDIPSRKINEFLRSFQGMPEQKTLNQLLLRAMQQAVYSFENIGHYGLAAPHYLHFTSPIRRYPDLIVHRLLKGYWKRAGRAPAKNSRKQSETRLRRIAACASERERAAIDVERESNDYYAALFMRGRVGEEFDAIVASLTSFGLFVEIEEAMVQGLIKIESLGSGVEFDEARMRITQRGSRRAWSVGDSVKALLVSVSVPKRQVTFELVQQESEKKRKGRAVSRGRTAKLDESGTKKTGKTPKKTANENTKKTGRRIAKKTPKLSRRARSRKA